MIRNLKKKERENDENKKITAGDLKRQSITHYLDTGSQIVTYCRNCGLGGKQVGKKRKEKGIVHPSVILNTNGLDRFKK